MDKSITSYSGGGKMLTAEVRIVDYYFEKLQEVWLRLFLNDGF